MLQICELSKSFVMFRFVLFCFVLFCLFCFVLFCSVLLCAHKSSLINSQSWSRRKTDGWINHVITRSGINAFKTLYATDP